MHVHSKLGWGRMSGEGKGIERIKYINCRRGLLKISSRVKISNSITRWDPVLENSIKGLFIHTLLLTFLQHCLHVSQFIDCVEFIYDKSQWCTKVIYLL